MTNDIERRLTVLEDIVRGILKYQYVGDEDLYKVLERLPKQKEILSINNQEGEF